MKQVQFIDDQRGAVAILGSAFLMSTILIAGLSIDHANTHLKKAQMQEALDSGVLTAARSPDNHKEIISSIYQANTGYGALIGEPVIIESENGRRVEATADYKSTLSFGGLLGVDSINIKVTAAASAALGAGKSSDTLFAFEDYESALVGRVAPPVTSEDGSLTMSFKNFFVVDEGNCAMGFWGASGCNVVLPQYQDIFDGRAVTMGSNGNAQFNTGTSEIEFNQPVGNVSFSMADFEIQFLRPGDNISAYDKDGKLISRFDLATLNQSASGIVNKISFEGPGIKKIVLLSQDPVGIDNLTVNMPGAPGTGEVLNLALVK